MSCCWVCSSAGVGCSGPTPIPDGWLPVSSGWQRVSVEHFTMIIQWYFASFPAGFLWSTILQRDFNKFWNLYIYTVFYIIITANHFFFIPTTKYLYKLLSQYIFASFPAHFLAFYHLQWVSISFEILYIYTVFYIYH